MSYVYLNLYEFFIHKIYIYHRWFFKLNSKYLNFIQKSKVNRIINKVRFLLKKEFQDLNPLGLPSGMTSSKSKFSYQFAKASVENNQNLKNICVCIGSLGHGGAEKQWVLLAVGLKLLGYSPTFVIQQNLNEASKPYVNLLNAHEINIVSISDLRDYSDFDSKVLFDLGKLNLNQKSISEFNNLLNHENKILEYTIKYFSNSNFSTMYAALDYSNIVFGISGLLLDIPKCLISFRSLSPRFYLENDVSPALYKAITENNSVLIHANSEHAAFDYSEYLATSKKIEVIPNLDFNLDPIVQERCTCNKFHVLGMMRFSREKSPISWLKAAEILFDNLDFKIHFILSGAGNQYQLIKESVIRLKLKGLDIDLEYIDNSISAMTKYSPGLMLVTSLTEGHSNLISEAKSAGYPIYLLFDITNTDIPNHTPERIDEEDLIHYVRSRIKEDIDVNVVEIMDNPSLDLKVHASKFEKLFQ